MSDFLDPSNPLIQGSGMSTALSPPTLKYFKRRGIPMSEVWGDVPATKETQMVIDFIRGRGWPVPNPGDPNYGNEVNRTLMRLKSQPEFRETDLSRVDWGDVALEIKPVTVILGPQRPLGVGRDRSKFGSEIRRISA